MGDDCHASEIQERQKSKIRVIYDRNISIKVLATIMSLTNPESASFCLIVDEHYSVEIAFIQPLTSAKCGTKVIRTACHCYHSLVLNGDEWHIDGERPQL